MKDAKRKIIGMALLLDDLTENLTVFVTYSGHVKNIRVRVYENYESGPADPIFTGDFYHDFRYFDDEENYQKTKDYLQSKIDEYTSI